MMPEHNTIKESLREAGIPRLFTGYCSLVDVHTESVGA